MNKRILNTAINKCTRFSDTTEWAGYLTDMEIVTLIEAGVTPTEYCQRHVERARTNIKYGISSPVWFYFHPNGLVMKDSLKKH